MWKRAEHPELAPELEELDAHHRAIDPLLARGDAVFTDLARTAPAALALVRALGDHLASHLDAEERVIIPHLRGANAFPLPPTDDVLAMYAEGFAWSSAGISQAVLEPLYAILPPALRERLPAAREAFAAHCKRVWGYVHDGTSLTSVPELHA